MVTIECRRTNVCARGGCGQTPNLMQSHHQGKKHTNEYMPVEVGKENKRRESSFPVEPLANWRT